MFTFKEIYNSKSTLAGMHEAAAKRLDWLRERIEKPGNYMSGEIYTKLCTNDIFRIESYNWWDRQTEIEPKIHLYKTATAKIGCYHFKAGDTVSVNYYHTQDGIDWYLCNNVVAYPKHHLERFVL